MHKPPLDQNLSPKPRKERSQSADGSQVRYIYDTEEHPALEATPKVQAIDLTALQKKSSVTQFKFSVFSENYRKKGRKTRGGSKQVTPPNQIAKV